MLPVSSDSALPRPSTAGEPVRWLVVLCAEWCGTCRDYRAVLDQVVQDHPGWRGAWIDIEDQADLVEDLDVETFPTVLIYEQAPGPGESDHLFFFWPHAAASGHAVAPDDAARGAGRHEPARPHAAGFVRREPLAAAVRLGRLGPDHAGLRAAPSGIDAGTPMKKGSPGCPFFVGCVQQPG